MSERTEMRLAGRSTISGFILLLVFSIGACGAERSDQELFGAFSERIGQPLDEVTMSQYMHETFTPGMDYVEVHDLLATIGDYMHWKEATFIDSRWEEVVELRTGTRPLEEENYPNWVFIYDADAKLTQVLFRSY